MKGLLLKDFYMIIKYCRSFALIIAVFLAVSIYADNNSFFISYPAILSCMIPQTLLAYEERARWNTYSLVFPYSKKQLVSSKYVLTVCMLAVTLVISAAAMLAKSAVTGVPNESFFDMLITIAATGIAAPSITMPVIFKFGTEKGRYAYIFTIGLVFALAAFIPIASSDLVSPSMNIPGGLLLAVCAALFALSWLISIRIYEKKEF